MITLSLGAHYILKFGQQLEFYFSKKVIKSSLCLRYFAEASKCNEWRGPSPRLNSWATQLQKNAATQLQKTPQNAASKKQLSFKKRCRAVGGNVSDLTRSVIEPQTSRTDTDINDNSANRRVIFFLASSNFGGVSIDLSRYSSASSIRDSTSIMTSLPEHHVHKSLSRFLRLRVAAIYFDLNVSKFNIMT